MTSGTLNVTAPAGRRRHEGFLIFGIVVCALLMTLKYFPGMENEAAYAGNMFQAIYPDAFPGDPNIGAERSLLEKPFQLSIIYLLPRLGGEIWLDDRFLAAVYLGLVFATLLGIDRIVVAAGLTEVPARLALQLILMRDHQILDNKVYLAHQPDMNHMAFAIPILVWLIYAAVSGKSFWLVLGLGTLAAAISVKNAPLVIAFSLIIVAINGGRAERIGVGVVFAVAAAVFYLVVTQVLVVPPVDRVVLFDLIYNTLERDHANTFYPEPDTWTMLRKNAVFAAVLGAALVLPGPKSVVMRNLRLFVGLGVGIWLLAGLYYSFTPDALKLPQIVPFTVGRNLRWPQTVAYIAIFIALVHWLRLHPGLRRSLWFLAAVVVITAIGPGNVVQWTALGFGSIAAVILIGTWRENESGSATRLTGTAGGVRSILVERPVTLTFHALVITIGVAFAMTIGNQVPYWSQMIRTGVLGNTNSAAWSGVDAYVRQKTPPDTLILPLRYHEDGSGRIIAERGLATRGGRSLTIFEDYSNIFDLKGWRLEQEQRSLMGKIEKAVHDAEWAIAADRIRRLKPAPDLIIVPTDLTNKADVSALGPFEVSARVGTFSVLRWRQ